MSDTDRHWFRKNPNSNFRVRRPGDGEVEELARRMAHGSAYELEMIGGKLPPPSDQVDWFVMIIKAAPDLFIRMLTLRDIGDDAKPAFDYALYAIAIGERLAIDRKG